MLETLDVIRKCIDRLMGDTLLNSTLEVIEKNNHTKQEKEEREEEEENKEGRGGKHKSYSLDPSHHLTLTSEWEVTEKRDDGLLSSEEREIA
ncbi:hypothetical protein LSM04_004731 [Trypanosoma melophagium]|uniref:uncharacterized protein n=1 Tax=Trypanosoma melophagium TaxID=715481 RepID=UPI003519FD33|nr:hypothetical protein LSM04_004731 [Trypanosoma melophagium]